MSLLAEDSIEKILLTYLHNKTFSGCAVGFSNLKEKAFKRKLYYQGKTDIDDSALDIDKKTFFDVASLTKPLVTVLSLLALKKERKIQFEETIEKYIPFTLPRDKKEIKIIDLIRHTSGLPAHREYFNLIRENKEILDVNDVINMIMKEELIGKPGNIYIYSDLDYILLGYLVEQLSGESMGSFWQRKISKPLNISEEFLWEDCDKRGIKNISAAVTGVCNWSGIKLCGIVHDDNCRAMNRISGHAGLFGTLTGILTLCEDILLTYSGRKENSSYSREDLLYLLKKRKKQHWAYGFDVPTGNNPSSGKFFSKKTIGHLGFTGTSFWIDLYKNRIVAVLTNRVIYGEDNTKIKEMRPFLHDALLK